MSKGNGHQTDEIVIERELPVRLTEAELLERGERMADAELEIERLKGQRKALNAQIAGFVETRATLAHTIESEHETRTVKCKWRKVAEENSWYLERLDTREVVESREMTAADRQMGLRLIDDDDEPLGAAEVVDAPAATVTPIAAAKRGSDDAKPEAKPKSKAKPKPPGKAKKKEDKRPRPNA